MEKVDFIENDIDNVDTIEYEENTSPNGSEISEPGFGSDNSHSDTSTVDIKEEDELEEVIEVCSDETFSDSSAVNTEEEYEEEPDEDTEDNTEDNTDTDETNSESTEATSKEDEKDDTNNEKTLEDVENELFQEATHSMNLTQSRSRRVVFSLTCHLQNYQYLDNTLECLIKFDVDRIYLNVNLDTYHRIKNKPLNPKVSLNPCRNWGPILKLLPTIQLESDPNTIIILVEVGYIYPPNMVSHMINLYEPYFKRGLKPSAYSATLYKLKSVSYFQKVIVHNNVGDVYESHEGTVFLRSFFRSDFTSYISHLIKDEACRYSEDLMISNYLYKYKIPIKCCLRKWYHSNLVFPYLKKTRLYMNSGIHFPIIYKFHKSVEYMSQHKMLYLRNSYAILESLRSLVKRPSHIPFS